MLSRTGTSTCGDLDALLRAVDTERPDVVLTDIRMPPGDEDEGIQAAERLRTTHPETAVVLLSQFSDPEYALALFEEGSARRAYLLKERVNDLEQLGKDMEGEQVQALLGELGRYAEVTQLMTERFV